MSISRRSFLASAAVAAAARRAPAESVLQSPSTQKRGEFDPWLEIDAAALAHNVVTLARLSGGRPIIAVVKNNAYGCGITTVGPILDRLPGVAALAAVRPEEARALRKAGVRKPVLLMGPASDDESLELARLDVRLAPYQLGERDRLIRLARRLGRAVRVHVYVDTGMHRMGMPHDRVLAWLDDAQLRRAIAVDGAFTELTEDQDFDREQAKRLSAIAAAAKGKGFSMGRLHAASSDAIAQATEETFLDAVRPGLTVYGGYPTTAMMARGELTPAYRLKARVIRVDRLAPGEGISYHRRWVAKQPTAIATLALGHVDGYPSGAVKGCEILIRGALRPVVGTVSASHTVVAIADEQGVQVSDEAIVVGPDDPAIHPNEVAKRAGYSEYDMFMHLNPALPRIVVGRV
jgi:alanine racemase